MLLGDLTTYGPWWSWIAASGILGVFFGLLTRWIPIQQGTFGAKEIRTFLIGETIANLVVWVIIAPDRGYFDLWANQRTKSLRKESLRD